MKHSNMVFFFFSCNVCFTVEYVEMENTWKYSDKDYFILEKMNVYSILNDYLLTIS